VPGDLRRARLPAGLDGGWYTDGGVYSLVEAMARPLDVRCGDGVARIERSGGPPVTGVGDRSGARSPATRSVSNADVLRTHELTAARRRCGSLQADDVCFLPVPRPRIGRFPRAPHHTRCSVARRYRDFIRP
jgi:phytoene desaturase